MGGTYGKGWRGWRWQGNDLIFLLICGFVLCDLMRNCELCGGIILNWE